MSDSTISDRRSAFPWREVLCLARKHFSYTFNSLGYEMSQADDLSEIILDQFMAKGTAAVSPVADTLDKLDVKNAWNAVLANDRAHFLSRWIAPHIEGSVLDLLCGDGMVGRLIADMTGNPVRLVERPGQRGTIVRSWSDSIEDTTDLLVEEKREAQFGTVLLCTALHHEVDPDAAFLLARKLARYRVVVVENCIEPDYPASYQQFVDVFFNCCLNRSGLPCPAQHRSADDWIQTAPAGLHLFHQDRAAYVPGVPLAHELLVFSLEAQA